MARRTSNSSPAELRGLVTLLGVQQFEQNINNLAVIPDKHPGSLSDAASRFADRRQNDTKAHRLFDWALSKLKGLIVD